MSLGKKIELARREKGWTQIEFAKRMGLSRDTIWRWETDKLSPKMTVLQKIAQATAKPTSYFMEEPSYTIREPSGVYKIESKKTAKGTVPTEIDIKDPHAFVLRIEGSSMTPRYLDGDYVIASPQKQPTNNRPVISKVKDNEATCRLYKDAGEYIHLIPINPEFDILIVYKKDVKWVYPVVGMYRKER